MHAFATSWPEVFFWDSQAVGTHNKFIPGGGGWLGDRLLGGWNFRSEKIGTVCRKSRETLVGTRPATPHEGTIHHRLPGPTTLNNAQLKAPTWVLKSGEKRGKIENKATIRGWVAAMSPISKEKNWKKKRLKDKREKKIEIFPKFPLVVFVKLISFTNSAKLVLGLILDYSSLVRFVHLYIFF